MKEINHPEFGQCFELTHPDDIAFARIAQGTRTQSTFLPSGTKTPAERLWFREHYLVRHTYEERGG